MRRQFCFVAIALAFGSLLTAAAQDQEQGKKGTIRETKVDGLKLPPVAPTAAWNKPVKIANDMELIKHIPDQVAQDKIKTQVNFKKEYLLYFRWTGSGTDKLSYQVVADKDKKPVVRFAYMAGFTDDVRHHARLFAIDKDAGWGVKE
jgi:hypothetical protein